MSCAMKVAAVMDEEDEELVEELQEATVVQEAACSA